MSVMAALGAYRRELCASSGRPNRATWRWNMEVSFEWGSDDAYVVSGTFRSTNGDSWPELASLNALLAEPGDVVRVSAAQHADPALVRYWRELDVVTSELEWVVPSAPLPSGLLICFGNGAAEEQLAAEHDLALFGGTSESFAQVNSKARVKRWCAELGIPTPAGRVCNNIEEIIGTASELLTRFDRVAIKDAYGASGRGILLVTSAERVQRLLGRMEGSHAIPEGCVVEGWYPVEVSHNSQWLVLPSGDVLRLGSSEQLLADQKYKGNFIPHRLERREPAGLREQQRRIAKHAFDVGYRGVLGIDSVLTRDGEVFPVIELNGRFNLSTYALATLEKIEHQGPSCLKSYTVPCVRSLQFAELFDLNGPFKLPLYQRGQTGLLPLGFTGSTTPDTKKVLRFIPLAVADTKEEVHALVSQCDDAMARVNLLHEGRGR